jgi:hypothetical protein
MTFPQANSDLKNCLNRFRYFYIKYEHIPEVLSYKIVCSSKIVPPKLRMLTCLLRGAMRGVGIVFVENVDLMSSSI